MKQEQKAIRFGLVMISFAVLWKLLSSGFLTPVAAFFQKPDVASFLLYLETGRNVKAQSAADPTTLAAVSPTAAAPTCATEETQPPPKAAAFTAEEARLVELYNATSRSPNLSELLTEPLQWDLTAEGPQVLILHTHTTESYTQTDGSRYVESSSYRTLDDTCNMVRVGDALTEVLESYGISVIHDRTLHDHPSYTGSYNNSRRTAQEYLQMYPSIRIILDIHRDAVELSGGRQYATSAVVDGTKAAQLMMVVGTNAGGLEHPNWERNLALALKLHVQLERTNEGIMRPVYLRTERFNQDLVPGALLIEVGAAGNTLEEAILAAEALGDAIGQLRYGANTE